MCQKNRDSRPTDSISRWGALESVSDHLALLGNDVGMKGKISGWRWQGRWVTLQGLWPHVLPVRIALHSVPLWQVGQKSGGGGVRKTTGTCVPVWDGTTKRSGWETFKAILLVKAGEGIQSHPDRMCWEVGLPLPTRPEVCALSEGPLPSMTPAHWKRVISSCPRACWQEMPATAGTAHVINNPLPPAPCSAPLGSIS